MVKMKMLAVLQLKKYILLHLFVRVKNNVWPLVHQFDWIIPREKKNETFYTVLFNFHMIYLTQSNR